MILSVKRTEPICRLTMVSALPGSERISSVEPPPISAINKRKSEPRLSERLTASLRKFRLFIARNHLEIDAGPLFDARDKIGAVADVAQRAGRNRQDFFRAGRSRAISANSTIVSSVRCAASGSSLRFDRRPFPRRVIRDRSRSGLQFAVRHELRHQHAGRCWCRHLRMASFTGLSNGDGGLRRRAGGSIEFSAIH